MRFVNHDGRLVLLDRDTDADRDLHGARGIDVHQATGGTIPAEPGRAYEHWEQIQKLAGGAADAAPVTIDRDRLGSPSPEPRQIFGIGINYADHGAEAGMALPDLPLVFTKLSTAVTGPFGEISLTTKTVDWEVEIAVIIGRRAQAVAASAAWEYVAGITAGQDLSDRDIQWRPKGSPQFSLGKSLAGFAPLGPILVTADEYPDPNDIELACQLNGDEVQRSSSAQMLLPVPEIISYLSGLITLLPGDVIFTGTPAGIGMTRTPPRYLKAGDRLSSSVARAGSMVHTFSAAVAQPADG